MKPIHTYLPFSGAALALRAGLAILAVAASPFAFAAAPASTSVVHVARYDLVSRGMTVGHVQATRAQVDRNGQACLELRIATRVSVKLMFYAYALQQDETWTTDAGGLIAYALDAVENGRRKTVTGELRSGVFHFDVVEKGRTRVWEAPRSAYDLSAQDQPEPTLTAGGKARRLRVLNPIDTTIVERTYREFAAEPVTVGKHRVMCRTVTIEDPGTHIRRWFIMDALGPLVLREDGREKRGTYSRRAVSVNPEQAIKQVAYIAWPQNYD